jgi:hypothetical protein
VRNTSETKSLDRKLSDKVRYLSICSRSIVYDKSKNIYTLIKWKIFIQQTNDNITFEVIL